MIQVLQMGAAERRPGAAPQTPCPKCGAARVRALTETVGVVSLGCDACRHVWTVRERRQVHRREAPARRSTSAEA